LGSGGVPLGLSALQPVLDLLVGFRCVEAPLFQVLAASLGSTLEGLDLLDSLGAFGRLVAVVGLPVGVAPTVCVGLGNRVQTKYQEKQEQGATTHRLAPAIACQRHRG
jgi:hypothetical protein